MSVRALISKATAKFYPATTKDHRPIPDDLKARRDRAVAAAARRQITPMEGGMSARADRVPVMAAPERDARIVTRASHVRADTRGLLDAVCALQLLHITGATAAIDQLGTPRERTPATSLRGYLTSQL
jgi:hypothetical protein